MTNDEAALLGEEFIYIHPEHGGWFIKKVHRDWEPAWAKDGVCVFLDHDICQARGIRPRVCSEYCCSVGTWPEQMAYALSQNKNENADIIEVCRAQWEYTHGRWHQAVESPATACAAIC